MLGHGCNAGMYIVVVHGVWFCGGMYECFCGGRLKCSSLSVQSC